MAPVKIYNEQSRVAADCPNERIVMPSKKGDKCLGNFGTNDEFQCGSFVDGGGNGSSGIFNSSKYPGLCEYLNRTIDGIESPKDCPYKA